MFCFSLTFISLPPSPQTHTFVIMFYYLCPLYSVASWICCPGRLLAPKCLLLVEGDARTLWCCLCQPDIAVCLYHPLTPITSVCLIQWYRYSSLCISWWHRFPSICVSRWHLFPSVCIRQWCHFPSVCFSQLHRFPSVCIRQRCHFPSVSISRWHRFPSVCLSRWHCCPSTGTTPDVQQQGLCTVSSGENSAASWPVCCLWMGQRWNRSVIFNKQMLSKLKYNDNCTIYETKIMTTMITCC